MVRSLRTVGAVLAIALGATGCVYVERVSLTTGGAEVTNDAEVTDISENGRFIVFQSSGQFDPGDTNGTRDVFVRDTLLDTTNRVSQTELGLPTNARSYGGRISDDGTKVVYQTDATNMGVGGPGAWTDTNGNEPEIVLWDSTLGAFPTRVLTELSCGVLCRRTPDRGAMGPDISGNGSVVVFASNASDLVAGDLNGTTDVFRRDLNGTISLVSLTDAEQQADDFSYHPSVNDNGTVIAFASLATNLTATPDTNGLLDVYARFQSGTTLRISQDLAGGEPDGRSTRPFVDGAGIRIAYESDATDLVPIDLNGAQDVFVRDLFAATTEIASVADDELGLPVDSTVQAMSAVDRRVLFLAADGSLYVRDLVEGRTDLVASGISLSALGLRTSVISADGSYVAYTTSVAEDDSDTNAAEDVYLHSYPEPVITSISPAAPRGQTTSVTVTGDRLSDVTSVFSDLSSSPSIVWSNVVVVDDTTITGDVTVGPTVPPGSRVVAVRTDGGGPGVLSGSLGVCACLTVT